MDITIRITPRRIERVIWILLVIGLLYSNYHFYNNSTGNSAGEEVEVVEVVNTTVGQGDNSSQTQAETEEVAQTSESDDTSDEDSASEDTSEEETAADETKEEVTCKAGYVCMDDEFLGYKKTDCTWDATKTKECEGGCKDGACEFVPCEVGWKCMDDYHVGRLNEDCSWSYERSCLEECNNATVGEGWVVINCPS